ARPPDAHPRPGPRPPFPAASAHAAYRRVAIMQASGIAVRPATRSTVLAPGLGQHAQAWPAPLPGRGWSRRCYPSNAGTGAATNAPYSSHLRRSPRGPAGQRPPRRHHDVREGQQGSVLLPSPTTSGHAALRYLAPRVLLADLRAPGTNPASAEGTAAICRACAVYAPRPAADRGAWSALGGQEREEPPICAPVSAHNSMTRDWRRTGQSVRGRSNGVSSTGQR